MNLFLYFSHAHRTSCRPKTFSKTLVGLIVYFFFTLSLPHQVTGEEADNKKLYGALTNYGLSMSGLIYSTATTPPPADIKGDDVKASLDRMITSYKQSVTQQRAGVSMLDATFDLAITTVDIGSGGSSIVATSAVRWVKNEAISGLRNKLEEDCQEILAHSIKRFTTDRGLTYEALQNKNPQEIKAVLDTAGVLSEIKGKLAGDPKAQEIVERATIDALKNTSKATLDIVSQNTNDIAATQDNLAKVSKGFSRYQEKTEKALTEVNVKLDEVQVAVGAAQNSLSELQEATAGNTEQLRMVSGFLYNKASAQEKLLMLRSGYLQKTLGPNNLSILIKTVEVQVKKENLVADIGKMVSTFNQIGQIADSLGVKGLGPAIAAANAVGGAVTNLVSGNYLGAIVSVTGLFGGKKDPEAERHQQLMNFLDEKFKEVNQKLVTLIKGQQKIMEGLGALANQMAEYDRALHERLNRMEFTLESIADDTREILFYKLNECNTLRTNIINETGRNPDLGPIIVKFADAEAIARVADADSLNECMLYLQTLYASAFDPLNLGVRSLGLRHLKATGHMIRSYYKKEDEEKYYQKSEIQAFYEKQYNPTWQFFLNTLNGKDLGLSTDIDMPTALALLALPVRSTQDFDRKVQVFTNKLSPSCVKNTLLSDPLVGILCAKDQKIVRTLDLKDSSAFETESHAKEMAQKIMVQPIMQDPLVFLVDWALFFAPINDHLDHSGGQNKIIQTLPEFLDKASPKPKGLRLLRGAAQTVTVGIAQMNMLYGDWTAKRIFDLLWKNSQDENRFFTEVELKELEEKATDEKAKRIITNRLKALGILKDEEKRNNPYLQRNMLMYALDRSSTLSGSGQKIAYEYALDYLKSATQSPDSALKVIFGKQWEFGIFAIPIGSFSDSIKYEEERKKCMEDNTKENCYRFPGVKLLGLTIPLPSADEFESRELVYPTVLRQLLAAREKLAARLSDYEVFDWAGVGQMDIPQYQETLAKALIQANR